MTEFWSILIDTHCQATWNVDGGFDWYFGAQDPATEGAIGIFLLTLLAKMQEKLATA
ncbi:hypothetical protein PTKU46_83890 [Paraburkholderia terrae]|uniref:hypothetical protein n=1 Tax=Paraburkholderia terrae TaxID=311230 RepID=UPI0030E523B8